MIYANLLFVAGVKNKAWCYIIVLMFIVTAVKSAIGVVKYAMVLWLSCICGGTREQILLTDRWHPGLG